MVVRSVTKQRPRVLIVNSALYIGGAENVTATLCRGLDRNRFDVFVAHMKGNGPIARDLESEGFDIVRMSRTDDGRRDLLAGVRLRRLAVKLGIDLIHSQDLHTMVDSSFSAWTVPGLRHVSTFHYGNYPRSHRRYHMLERLFLRFPDRLVAVGEVQRQAIAHTYDINPDRLSVIRNGVSDSRGKVCDAEKDRVRRGADVVIGTISTLIEQKGIDDLLRAARLLVDRGCRFRLVIVGDGHLKAPLQTLSRELDLEEHVEFLGWVEDAASRVLPWVDIFVQSSLWEAMSMVVLEAMSSGCAIVATTVGDNPYVMRDGQSGLLVPSRSPESLANGLRRLIEDEVLRDRLANEARRDYEERFTASRMCRDYENLYLETLGVNF